MLKRIKKLLSQIISIYGCNASPPAGKMSFFITHWQSLNNRCRLYGWCCGWRQETLCIWGANSSWLCSFSFLILKSQSQLRCQGTTAQRGESCHCTASQPPRDSGLAQPQRQGPLWVEIPYFSHTHQLSTFQQYQLLGQQQSSQEQRETCIYYCVSALWCATFEAVCPQWRALPSHRRLWNHAEPQSFLPHTAFPSRPGEGQLNSAASTP